MIVARGPGRIETHGLPFSEAVGLGTPTVQDTIVILGLNKGKKSTVLSTVEDNRIKTKAFPSVPEERTLLGKKILPSKPEWTDVSAAVCQAFMETTKKYGVETLPLGMCVLVENREGYGGVPKGTNISDSIALETAYVYALESLTGIEGCLTRSEIMDIIRRAEGTIADKLYTEGQAAQKLSLRSGAPGGLLGQYITVDRTGKTAAREPKPQTLKYILIKANSKHSAPKIRHEAVAILGKVEPLKQNTKPDQIEEIIAALFGVLKDQASGDRSITSLDDTVVQEAISSLGEFLPKIKTTDEIYKKAVQECFSMLNPMLNDLGRHKYYTAILETFAKLNIDPVYEPNTIDAYIKKNPDSRASQWVDRDGWRQWFAMSFISILFSSEYEITSLAAAIMDSNARDIFIIRHGVEAGSEQWNQLEKAIAFITLVINASIPGSETAYTTTIKLGAFVRFIAKALGFFVKLTSSPEKASRKANILGHMFYNTFASFVGWQRLTVTAKTAGKLSNPLHIPDTIINELQKRANDLRNIEPNLLGVPLFNISQTVAEVDITVSQGLSDKGMTNAIITAMPDKVIEGTVFHQVGTPAGPTQLNIKGTDFTIKVGHTGDNNSPVAIYLDFNGKKVKEETFKQASLDAIREFYANPIFQSILSVYGVVINPKVAPIVASPTPLKAPGSYYENEVLSKAVFTNPMAGEDTLDYLHMLGKAERLKPAESAMRPPSNIAVSFDMSKPDLTRIRKQFMFLGKMQVTIVSATNVKLTDTQWMELVSYAKAQGITLVRNTDMPKLLESLGITKSEPIDIAGLAATTNIRRQRDSYIKFTLEQNTSLTDPKVITGKIEDCIINSNAGVIEIPFELLAVDILDFTAESIYENEIIRSIKTSISARIENLTPQTPQEHFAAGKRLGNKIPRLPAIKNEAEFLAAMAPVIGMFRTGLTGTDQNLSYRDAVTQITALAGWEGLDLVGDGTIANNAQLLGFMYAVIARTLEKGEETKEFAGFAEQSIYRVYGSVRLEAHIKGLATTQTESFARRWAAHQVELDKLAASGQDPAMELNKYLDELTVEFNNGLLPPYYDSKTLDLIAQLILKYAEKALPDFKKLLNDAANQATDTTFGTELIQTAG